jgi:hypothetical protein
MGRWGVMWAHEAGCALTRIRFSCENGYQVEGKGSIIELRYDQTTEMYSFHDSPLCHPK